MLFLTRAAAPLPGRGKMQTARAENEITKHPAPWDRGMMLQKCFWLLNATPNDFWRRNVLLTLLYYQPQSETPENAWRYFSTLHRNAEIILHPLKWGGATECWFFRTNYLKWVETSADFAYYDLRHANYFAMLSTKTRSDRKLSNIFQIPSNIRRCFHTICDGAKRRQNVAYHLKWRGAPEVFAYDLKWREAK